MAVISDIIEDLSGNELEGHVESATRTFYATGGASTNAAIILEAYAASGIPIAGEWFPGNTNLVCTGRRVELLPGCNRNVKIVCQYVRLGMTKSGFIFSGSTQLGQVNTQLDKFGNQVYVSHTWAGDDNDWPSQTHLQGMDQSLLIPQSTLTATGQLQVAWPDQVARVWAGSMNSTYWSGSPATYWMCTRVDFSGLDVGLGRLRWWEFTFEFQFSPAGWQPRVFFVDPRTGKPPSSLVPGLGYKFIDWYGLLDFTSIFPVA